jgi:hypothetical protein
VTPDERQPWEVADESGRPREEVPPTSEPIEEEERGDAEARTERNGAPASNDAEDDSVNEEEEAPQYADEDAEEHSDPKGPAAGAGGPV